MAKTRDNTRSKRPHAAIAAQRSNHPLLYVGSMIVLIIITVTFIGTPAIGRFGGAGTGTVFGTYDGIDIEHRRGNYFDNQILLISQQRRGVSNRDTATEARAVVRQAFQRAAYRVAVLAETSRSDLAISGQRIDGELIRSGPYVVAGVFSEERYNATPASQRKFNRQLVEERLLERQYFSDLGALHTSSQSAAFFREMAATERRFAVAAFSFAELPEAELRRYGTDNATRFRRIKLSRILLRGDDNEAEEVLRRLDDGAATFEELARLFSADDIATGGAVGWRYSYDLERDFESSDAVEAIFALEAGRHTPVLGSRFGDVIYRADAAMVAPDFEDAEVRAAVQDYLQRYERGVIEDYYAAQAAEFQQRAQAEGFAAAATALDVETLESDFFPINFRNLIAVSRVAVPDSDALQTAPFYEEFFERAFSLASEQVSAPIVLPDRILILQLLEERPADTETLDRVEAYQDAFTASALDREMRTQVFDSDRLVDDFDAGYANFLRVINTPVQGPPTQAAF